MWFLLIHSILAIWVFVDGLKRKANVFLWVIGTIILGPIILPVYISKRPSKVGGFYENSKYHNLFKFFAVFWTILLILTTIWTQKKDINCAVESETLEYRLAVINTGGYVQKDDVPVLRFQSLLEQLSNKCVEDQQQIANISVIAHNRIRANGINTSLLNIMEDLNGLICSGLKNLKYTEYIYTYIGLRKGGLSHNEAIERFQALIKGY